MKSLVINVATDISGAGNRGMTQALDFLNTTLISAGS
jgi:hypothetical protein